MARPKKDIADKFTSRFPTTQCTDEQLASFQRNAKQVSMSMSEYTRQMLASGQVILKANNRPQSNSFELALVHYLKHDIGKWLNTLAHRANSTGILPQRLQDCLRALIPILDHVLLSVRLCDNFSQVQGKQSNDNFNDDLIFQIQRIDTNLIQLSNIATVKETEIKDLSICLEKTETLLDRFVYTQTFNE